MSWTTGHFFDRDGNPTSLWVWAALRDKPTYMRVARTTIASAADVAHAYDVSTVWLGIDHGFGIGPPVIFETMVFGDTMGDLACERYITEAAARRGHDQMVREVLATVTDPVLIRHPAVPAAPRAGWSPSPNSVQTSTANSCSEVSPTAPHIPRSNAMR